MLAMDNAFQGIVKMDKDPINTMMEVVILVGGKMANFTDKVPIFGFMRTNMLVNSGMA